MKVQAPSERLSRLVSGIWELADDGRHRDADVAAAVRAVATQPGGLPAIRANLDSLAVHPVALDAAIELVLTSGHLGEDQAVDAESLAAEFPQVRHQIEQAALLNQVFGVSGLEHPGRTLPFWAGPAVRGAGTAARRFEVVEVLGTGSCSSVYRAIDHELSLPSGRHEVAIKVLDFPSATKDQRDAMLREAAKLRRVSHPNVVRVFDQFHDQDLGTVIVMELVHDGTLEMLLREELTTRQVHEVMTALCDGLEAAHSSGVIHGDLKPANVLVAREPSGVLVPKLADFGIARIDIDPIDQAAFRSTADCRIGNRFGLAPEVAGGCDATVRSDVYGLGMLMLLAFSRPSRGATESGHDAFADVATLLSQLSEKDVALAQICKTATAHDPADRWGSVAELRVRLMEWEHGGVIQGVAMPYRQRTCRWLREYRRPVGVAAALGLVVATGGLAVSNWRERLAFDRGVQAIATMAEGFVGGQQSSDFGDAGFRDSLTMLLGLGLLDSPEDVSMQRRLSAIASSEEAAENLLAGAVSGSDGLEANVMKVGLASRMLETSEPSPAAYDLLREAERYFTSRLSPTDPWLHELQALTAAAVAKREAIHRTRGEGSRPDDLALNEAFSVLHAWLSGQTESLTLDLNASQARDPVNRLATRSLWHLAYRDVLDVPEVFAWCERNKSSFRR